MSMLRVGAGAPSAWACPAENVELPEDEAEAQRLEQALASFCAKFFGSLVDGIGRTANRAHLLTETVHLYQARLESAHLLSHPDISKLSSDFRTQLMGYLMPTFVEMDRLEDCQEMLATVLSAEHAAALPLPTPPPHHPPSPSPPPRQTTPAVPRSVSESALDALQRDLNHVAHWVSAHQRAYSHLRDEDKEEKPKTKAISKWKPYERLEEETDLEEEATSGEARPPKAATSGKSISTEYLSPQPSPPSPSLSDGDPDQPPYSMAFVLYPDSPDKRLTASADGNSQAAAPIGASASHGAIGISQDVQSALDLRGSDESKTTECETSAVAVTEGVEGAPAAATGRGAAAPATGTAGGGEPAAGAREPGPSRNWVRAALSSVMNAMKAARPSVSASANDSPAYSPAASATGANGNGNASGDGDGNDGSALSGLKPPSVRRREVSRISSQRERLGELRRQHGLLRSALLRHSHRLWLEVRGRPRVQRPPADARLALLSRFRESLRDAELELRDAQRQAERRAERLAAIGRELWPGTPLPAVATAQVHTGGGPAASAVPALSGGPQMPPPPAAPARGSGNTEMSCGRLLWLLCSCFTCLPRRQ